MKDAIKLLQRVHEETAYNGRITPTTRAEILTLLQRERTLSEMEAVRYAELSAGRNAIGR